MVHNEGTIFFYYYEDLDVDKDLEFAHMCYNCKKKDVKAIYYIETSVVNKSDVKHTKSISNKPLSILRQNW